MQKNWIGKSFGTEVVFQVVENNAELPVFTTRVDTIYGVTYAVVAPEHPIVDEILKVNPSRSEEHTSELQSRQYLVCRLLLEKKIHSHTFSLFSYTSVAFRLLAAIS